MSEQSFGWTKVKCTVDRVYTVDNVNDMVYTVEWFALLTWSTLLLWFTLITLLTLTICVKKLFYFDCLGHKQLKI